MLARNEHAHLTRTRTDLHGEVQRHSTASRTVREYDADEEYECVICTELMHAKVDCDPVLAEDGRAYCRPCIEKWFTNGRLTSPLTNLPIGRKHQPLHQACTRTHSLSSMNVKRRASRANKRPHFRPRRSPARPYRVHRPCRMRELGSRPPCLSVCHRRRGADSATHPNT